MKKKKYKLSGEQKMMTVVEITFQDHTASTDGGTGPGYFTAVGIMLEETKLGYQLGHWVAHDPEDLEKDQNVTSYIAKVAGLKVRTIGHVVRK